MLSEEQIGELFAFCLGISQVAEVGIEPVVDQNGPPPILSPAMLYQVGKLKRLVATAAPDGRVHSWGPHWMRVRLRPVGGAASGGIESPASSRSLRLSRGAALASCRRGRGRRLSRGARDGNAARHPLPAPPQTKRLTAIECPRPGRRCPTRG